MEHTVNLKDAKFVVDGKEAKLSSDGLSEFGKIARGIGSMAMLALKVGKAALTKVAPGGRAIADIPANLLKDVKAYKPAQFGPTG